MNELVPFIQDFLEHTKQYESPTSFWKWAAYATIAGILRDNCFLVQGDDKLFANMYILLLADSAVQRKGRPVRLAQSLLKRVNNTKIISGKSSIQGIFDEMMTNETDRVTGKVVKGGSAIFFAEELAAALVADPQAVSHLTDMYDFKDDYKERLRGKGKGTITNMVFSLFAGSNDTLLRSLYDKSAVHGGLLGRTFLVIPNEFRQSNSLFDLKDTGASFNNLVNQLIQVGELKGNFEVLVDAQKEYNSWYYPFRESYKNKGDKSGIAGRIHTGVLKLSFILAANELRKTVCKCDIEQAIAECIALIPNYNSFIMISGKSTLAEAGGTLLTTLLECPAFTMSRKKFLQIHWNDIPLEMLDKVAVDLETGGHIRTIVNNNDVCYQLTEYCIKFMRGEKDECTNG